MSTARSAGAHSSCSSEAGSSSPLACGAGATICTAAAEFLTKVSGSAATFSRCSLKEAFAATISSSLVSSFSSSCCWLLPTSCEEGALSREGSPSRDCVRLSETSEN